MPSRAIEWWRVAIQDGTEAARKKRAKFFEVYLAEAEKALEPGELSGAFWTVYRQGFRTGYDYELDRIAQADKFAPRPRKRVKLG